jgi:hypothetical protein
MVGVKATAGYSIQRAGTGRKIDSMTPDEQADDELVVEWRKCTSLRTLRKHKGAKRFLELMKSVPIVTDSTIILL